MNSGTCACRTGTFDSCPDHPPRDTCPVCLHPAEMHQPDGCWFTMTIARPNSLSGCPCGVRREADAEPNRAPFLVRQLDATKAVLGYREQELLTTREA